MIFFFVIESLLMALISGLPSTLPPAFCQPRKVFDFQMIEKKLQGEIVKKIPMQDFLSQEGQIVHFTSAVFFVELSTDEKAVMKEVSPTSAVAEVAAYLASCFLEFNFVPPTRLYAKDGIVASLQHYVEPSVDLAKESNYEMVLRQLSAEERANIDIFYFVFGQWDPDGSNGIAMKLGEKFHLFLIDNAGMSFEQKVRFGEHPFVKVWPLKISSHEEKPFPFDQVRMISHDLASLRQELGDFLPEKKILTLSKVRSNTIYFILWKGHFWRQFRFGKPLVPEIYPPRTMEKLKRLTLPIIKGFFQNDIGAQFSEEFFNDILDRRDLVIRAYEQHLATQKAPPEALRV